MAENPQVGVVMGSDSDWEVMGKAVAQLQELGIPCEAKVMSAHRAPDAVSEYAASAEGRGLQCLIAGAGLAAHLPGVLASKTNLPVLGVPLKGGAVDGMDSLLSIVQMPRGVPVATFALGNTGAVNAALFAAQVIGRADGGVAERFAADRRARCADAAKDLEV